MGTVYSGWSVGWKPSDSKYYKHYRARLDYTIYDYPTYVQVYAVTYVNIDSSVTAYYKAQQWATGYGTSANNNVTTTFEKGNTVAAVSATYTWYKSTSAQTKYVYGSVWSDKKSWTGQWMTATASIPITALASYQISYDPNGGSGTVSPQVKYYSKPLTLTTNKFVYLDEHGEESKSFVQWNDLAHGTSYVSGGTFPANANYAATLTAEWQDLDPPTCEISELTPPDPYESYTKNFSDISVTLTDIFVKPGRTPFSVTLTIGSTSKTISNIESFDDLEISVTPTESGILPVTLIIEDAAGNRTIYDLGTIEVANPTWSITATYSTLFPDTDAFGNSAITVYAGQNGGTSEYDQIVGTYNAVDNGDSTWSIEVQLTEDYVDDTTSANPNASIEVVYNHTDAEDKETMKAFYETTRNANFSTGISNTMFVSGCEAANYSSRVWWSQINNPLYFPDLNYIEVGSNDTSVMGLCKVGDYLGVVKQSKTTDTAIFLVYPTSFEDDTTYAVKQLSSGIGAYGKYTFNVLGDETMFLSPNGVMAIVTGEDKDHKVQNRSYYVDGKLLKEPQIKDAYSFVFDGKYYLAIDKHMYVLDGNQRNSWGNDRTNLVYECYFLDNVPAECLVKYNDELYFSNDYGLCKFKSSSDENAYTDAFNDDEPNVPVKARWSTIMDDDGSLNYYKTMQKKGNLISVLPNVPIRFSPVQITEEEFNADKTHYYINDGGYVRCTEESVYDPATIYFAKDELHTKVYVKKDNNDRVEIQRQFGESTEIPSELFVNKKFKKYKRLQFIVENNEAEPFGVDSIIKQYTVGNYAKR